MTNESACGVEGDTDEPVVKSLTKLVGWDPEFVSVEDTKGKSNLDKKLAAYNEAARWPCTKTLAA